MNSVCSAARNQVTVLGINSLFGKVVSFLLKQSPVANRLVLYDEVDIGVAHDIAEIPTPCKIVVYNGEEQLRCAVKNSDVILIGDKDDCLANVDEAISRKAADIIRYAQAISTIAPNAIVLIAATPVNSLVPLFTEAQIGYGTFDSDKVMGVTSADTMRASTLLARHMGIDPEKAYLPVIGGASADTRIPLFSQSRPTINASKNDLKNLTRVVKMTEDDLKRMLNRGEALNKAYATVQLIDSVMSALRGQRNISEIVLSRTCLVPNVDYFSLPVILGPRGIAHRFPLPSLTERESILLDHAVKHIEIDKMKGINALSGECCIPQAPEMTEKYSELINCGPNDLVGSLMEKFKIGMDCPEVCAPSVEYKLLSKGKLRLPPESKPSEMPKRTKFIEPDTPPQDGCCPLKLPCPPIPPIRGLNQIQAKHTCKSRDKPKPCKCFFPPVEKTLVPCKLCASNKPCVDYGDFKTFFEEHKHCCGPVSSADEAIPGSSVAMIAAGNNNNVIEACQTPQVQPSDTYAPEAKDVSDMKAKTIGPGETDEDPEGHAKKMNFHAVWTYCKSDAPSQPTSVMEQSVQTTTNQVNPPDKRYSIDTTNQKVQDSTSDSKSLEPWSSLGQHHTAHTTEIKKRSNDSTSTAMQHDDPNWSLGCSTALCLDVLAPKPPGHQYAHDKSAGQITNQAISPQKQHELHKEGQATENSPNLTEDVLTVQKVNVQNQEQHKRFNYSSGLSLKNPQDVIEVMRPSVHEKLQHKSSNQECTDQATNELSNTVIQNLHQPNSSSCCAIPNGASKAPTETIRCKQESSNNESDLSIEVNPQNSNTVPSAVTNAERQSSKVQPSNTPQAIADLKRTTEMRAYDRHLTMDDNVKRRLYATLKIIEDIKPEAIPSTSTSNKTTGLSLSQHFNDETKPLTDTKNVPKSEGYSENSMISILRERAKAINVNLDLQRDLQASLDQTKRKRQNLGLGGLMDTINPAKRLPKRLQSRPALRKAYRGLQKMYEDPKHLASQGKSASLLVSHKSENKQKSLVVVENPKESVNLGSRIDRIKARIQAALKKIIYPADATTEMKPAQKVSKQHKLSHKLVTRPATKRSSKAKQNFIIEMRKMDPAYRTTTRIYAPKCPTRLLYDDHPKNHTKMITFNNVLETDTIRTPSRGNHKEPSSGGQDRAEGESLTKDRSSPSVQKDLTKRDENNVIFPNVPDFPELFFKEMELKRKPKGTHNTGALHFQKNSMAREDEPKCLSKESVGSSEVSVEKNPQETRFSGVLRGDYVKHFVTQSLPKDTNAVLSESLKAAIREHSRNVATPGSIKAQRRHDVRYRMTSPNRLTYSRRPN